MRTFLLLLLICAAAVECAPTRELPDAAVPEEDFLEMILAQTETVTENGEAKVPKSIKGKWTKKAQTTNNTPTKMTLRKPAKVAFSTDPIDNEATIASLKLEKPKKAKAAKTSASLQTSSTHTNTSTSTHGATVVGGAQTVTPHADLKVQARQVINNFHRACNHTGHTISTMRVVSATGQVQNGMLYTLKVKASFQPPHADKVFTVQLLEKVDHDSIHETVGGTKSNADRFHTVSVHPRVCGTNELFDGTFASTVPSEDLLEMHRHSGLVNEPMEARTWDDTELTEEEAGRSRSAIDWHTIAGPTSRAAQAVWNQGTCGSCYAWAATTAYAYRLFLWSHRKFDVHPGAQMAISCTNGCNGGSAESVFRTQAKVGGFVPMWCSPYDFKAPKKGQCRAGCRDGPKYSVVKSSIKSVSAVRIAWKRARTMKPNAADVRKAEKKMVAEISRRGPVFGQCHASPGLQGLKGWDIFRGHHDGAKVSHAITIVGYGAERGKKYWVIQNSWGPSWGHGGYARIERGVDALGIESGGYTTVMPAIPKYCPHKTKAQYCKNGGSFNTGCSCHCVNGFSGPTCATCNRKCNNGGNTQGRSFIKGGKCMCGCKQTWYTIGGTECKTRLAIMGKSAPIVVADPVKSRIGFTVKNDGKAVTGGDMFVMVPKGVTPYTNAGGWHSDALKSSPIPTKLCGKACSGQVVPPTNYNVNALGVSGYAMFKGRLLKKGYYDMWFFKYLGKNEFGGDKGWGRQFKLSQQVLNTGDCYNKASPAFCNRVKVGSSNKMAIRYCPRKAGAPHGCNAGDKWPNTYSRTCSSVCKRGGVRYCKYSNCKGCPICKLSCYNRYSRRYCWRWKRKYGCGFQLAIGRHPAKPIWQLCGKTCGKCGRKGSWK
jgi:hypothetical protein